MKFFHNDLCMILQFLSHDVIVTICTLGDYFSIQFNSIQFFIHTIQDIYISVHSRKIK